MARRTGLSWALVALLLLVQTLGVWHRSQHGLGVAVPVATVAAAAASGPGADAPTHQGWGHALGGLDCRLFDHSALGDGLAPVSTPLVLPLLAANRPAVAVALAHAGAADASYQARAPPRG